MGGKTNVFLDTGFDFKIKGILMMETTKHNKIMEGGREGDEERGGREGGREGK